MYPRETSSHNNLSWNKLEPSKVSTFAWRFINDRLSTKFNLFMRGYLCNDFLLCSVGCSAIEDIHASYITELPHVLGGLE
jgi:hypothetical protein